MDVSLWHYRARFVDATDGDTIKLQIDLGMSVHTTQSIRIAGVNASEVNSEEGRKAKAFAANWFMWHNHAGDPWPFAVRTQKDRRSFTRYVGTVICEDGHDFGEDLITAKFGVRV